MTPKNKRRHRRRRRHTIPFKPLISQTPTITILNSSQPNSVRHN